LEGIEPLKGAMCEMEVEEECGRSIEPLECGLIEPLECGLSRVAPL
jgi:hypothetical protein